MAKSIKMFCRSRLDRELLQQDVNEFLKKYPTSHWTVEIDVQMEDGKILVTIIYW